MLGSASHQEHHLHGAGMFSLCLPGVQYSSTRRYNNVILPDNQPKSSANGVNVSLVESIRL